MTRDVTQDDIKSWLSVKLGSTRTAYSRYVRLIAKFYRAECDADAIQLMFCRGAETFVAESRRFLRWMRMNGKTRHTTNAAGTVIGSISKYLRKVGVTEWSSTADSVPVDSKKDMSGPSPSAVRACVDKILRTDRTRKGFRDALIISMMAGMGLRVSEIAAIDIEDIDFSRRIVRVNAKGIRGKKRSVHMSSEVVSVLGDYMALSCICNGKLFPGESSTHRGDSGVLSARHMQRIVEARFAGIWSGGPVSQTRLRHTFGTASVSVTEGVAGLASGLMGHASTMSICAYDDMKRSPIRPPRRDVAERSAMAATGAPEFHSGA